MLLFSFTIKAQIEIEAGPTKTYPGCPQDVFLPWTVCQDPSVELPQINMSDRNFKLCYDCSYGICQTLQNWDCNNPCVSIIKFEMVFDPKNNTYVTVYQVRPANPLGTDIGVYYCYNVYAVPIYLLDEDGKPVYNPDGTRKQIGVKYIWVVIPGVVEINRDVQHGFDYLKY